MSTNCYTTKANNSGSVSKLIVITWNIFTDTECLILIHKHLSVITQNNMVHLALCLKKNPRLKKYSYCIQNRLASRLRSLKTLYLLKLLVPTELLPHFYIGQQQQCITSHPTQLTRLSTCCADYIDWS